MGIMQLIVCVIITVFSLQGSAAKVAAPQRSRSLPHVKSGQPPSMLPNPGKKTHGKKLPAEISSSDGSPTTAFHRHHAHKSLRPSSIAVSPSIGDHARVPVSSPVNKFGKHHHRHHSSSAPEPSHPVPTHNSMPQGPSVSPFSSSITWVSPALAPAPSTKNPSGHFNSMVPAFPPSISPLSSSLHKMKPIPPLPPVMTLPPPPPNDNCALVTCTEPLTSTPAGSACGCVWPIQVKLQLGVAIYTFFPLVSELAGEIAASVALNHSQVRITGADAASLHQEKTTVLVDLVPRDLKFSDVKAFSIYKKFWQNRVYIKPSLFGDYEVSYVQYPGLPPSPPSSTAGSTIDGGPYPGQTNNGQAIKPLGVDIPRLKTDGLSRNTIIIIVLSSFAALVLFIGFVWLFLLKCGACVHKNAPVKSVPSPLSSSLTKPSEFGRSMAAYKTISGPNTLSMSSCTTPYTGSAKTFTLNDVVRATNNFDDSRLIGEGGFGVVYGGVLDDGSEVAVKVLKRDDLRGGREFMAEIEMLGRLHHRNLIKLIGICYEDHARCLVYVLVPNGSVESHLHGVDKVTGPLDWCARMKIALGAARGLAYLHEDSNPLVIHRDFKSSNILLEHDFTAKVSDFGLARTGMNEGQGHISTHVMGTFGYLAPEYAMTGHLLVKSDVYSYGVVLLELLTGRKPVDLSMPPGQENLVAFARPLLTTREGLETIIDPVIMCDASFDSIVKVAAIASMCVQPEVSHRPFMGEVVQALKLVCNEFDEIIEPDQPRGRQSHGEDSSTSMDIDNKANSSSGELLEFSRTIPAYNFSLVANERLSASILVSSSVVIRGEDPESSSFRRYFSSGPLRTGRRRQFWHRLRSLSRGSVSEHGFSVKLWTRS